ncbi:META domain-containing protein [Streptomyces sp. NPDC056352]|uniref:META domain-containing protein n=1 Tax=Streptomyces sp. NPDC056352 TaxID=3345791 RepID=UPI0035E33F8E
MAVSVGVLALLALVGCGTKQGHGAGTGSGSDDRGSVTTDLAVTDVYWKAASVTVGGRRTAAPDGAHVTITPEGRARGNSGCNSFSAAVKMNGDEITVGRVMWSAMGCRKDTGQFERTMSRTFSGTLTAAVTDRTLTLTTATGDAIAFTSEPAAPLIGTTWTVTTLISGSVASSLPAGAEKKARLSFGKDDSVQGSPGCNQIRGAATVSGSAITFGRINGTKMMCPDPQMKVERALFEILEGRTTYRIDHRTLTLTAANGEGFSATASAPGK